MRPWTVVMADFLHAGRMGEWTPFEAATAVGRELGREGYVIVPKEAIAWLDGEDGTFEPPPGARGKFWWRSEFRRRANLPKDST